MVDTLTDHDEHEDWAWAGSCSRGFRGRINGSIYPVVLRQRPKCSWLDLESNFGRSWAKRSRWWQTQTHSWSRCRWKGISS